MKEGGIIKKYLDIKEIYNIEDISNGEITINILGKKKKIYIFRVTPVIIVNPNNHASDRILGMYEEYLRMQNLDFEIVIENEEIDISRYFDMYEVQNDEQMKEMILKYRENVENLLKNSKVFIYNYYFIISSEFGVENVENFFKIFEDSDMIVKKIISKKEIEEIIMKGVGLNR